MSGRVFVVQRPVFKTVQGWADKYDLTAALEHGRIVECLPTGKAPSDVGERMRLVQDALRDFDDGDCLLAIGDPFMIACAVLTAGAANGGRVRMLKWDRITGRYEPQLATG